MLCRTLFSLEGAVCALAVGNAVVFPTDTVFGLGVSVSAARGPAAPLRPEAPRRRQARGVACGRPRGAGCLRKGRSRLCAAPRRDLLARRPHARGARLRCRSPPPSNRPRAPSACACPQARRHSGSSAPPAVLWPSPRPTSPGPPTRPASKISIARWWPAPPACTFPMIPCRIRPRPEPPAIPMPLPHLLASRRAIDWCHRPLLAPPPPCSTAPARPPASCARAPLPSTT